MASPVISIRLQLLPRARALEVRLRLPVGRASHRIRFPAWTPGSYLVRDFARNVTRAQGVVGNGLAQLSKVDKQTWLIEGAADDVPIEAIFQMHCADPSVRGAYVDDRRAFAEGAAILPWVEGWESSPHELELAPVDNFGWCVETSMSSLKVNDWGFGTYREPDYLSLIDHPLVWGELDRLGFRCGGRPHRIVLHRPLEGDGKRLAADVGRVCRTHLGLFHNDAPFQSYAFMLRLAAEGYGGLEHRASSALLATREAMPRPSDKGASAAYRQLLGLFSHEYFHAWNVKAIAPAGLGVDALAAEMHFTHLWVFEGVTAYYDDLALVRSGVIHLDHYLQALAETITRVFRGNGRRQQTLAESSYDAWTRFYKQDANAPNAIVSYYAKGALVALSLDLLLRERSGGATSLDDVMRVLWVKHGRTGLPLAEGDFERVAADVADESLEQFFSDYVYGVEDPPLAELLRSHGIELHWRPAHGYGDAGGRADTTPFAVDLGGRIEAAGAGVRVAFVADEGPLARAGVIPGDEIVAWQGRRPTVAGLERFQRDAAPGDHVELHVVRDGLVQPRTLRLEAAAKTTAWLRPVPQPAVAQQQLQSCWLADTAVT